MYSTVLLLALATAASARPTRFGRRASFDLANWPGRDCTKFATLTPTSACTTGQDACVNQQFAQCVSDAFVLQPCAGGTICAALPLVNSAGTSVTCTTQADLDARIAATGATSAAAAPPASTDAAAANTTTAAAAAPPAASSAAAAAPPPADNAGAGAAAGGGDLQSSTTLDPSVILNPGAGTPAAGQASAAVSTNNFINFCAIGLPQTPLTNGLQITGGSCNPTPIGNIPSSSNMPSSKFQNPTNGDTLVENTPFNVTLRVQGAQLGTFTAATETYFANPQTLNAQGQIIGHTHIVIESVASLASTTLTNPQAFVFFKGVDGGADANGDVVVPVAAGLPAGTYRMGTILSSATHQPVIVPVAQHGLVDDVIYMTVSASGAAAATR
ncbi:hypothetical protein B0H11DRAFT_1916261 [Mycena galericulata]|nr:hypothetical protein B0H11DRAFT_1916261 [Mycena galericulata]